MRSILVINDHSSAANCAAKFALSIAQKVGANLVLLNAVIPVNILPDMEYEFVPENGQADYLPLPEAPLTEQLTMQNQCYEKFRPEITVSSHDLFFLNNQCPSFSNRAFGWL